MIRDLRKNDMRDGPRDDALNDDSPPASGYRGHSVSLGINAANANADGGGVEMTMPSSLPRLRRLLCGGVTVR